MDDLSFLQHATKGTFRVIVRTPEGKTMSLDSLDGAVLSKKCPAMLSTADYDGDDISYTFKNKSTDAVISLLRHIYLGNYTYCAAALERPCSLHIHLQVLQLARLLDMAELQNSVHCYILEEIERFHETKAPVHELYEGIVFLYTELRDCKNTRDIIASYCVDRFAHFLLYEKEIFRQIAFESPLFHKDLQHANVSAGFENEAAMEIVRLPVCGHRIHSMNVDFACQHHALVPERDGVKTPTPESMRGFNRDRIFALTLQAKEAAALHMEDPKNTTPPSMQDTLVLRPRVSATIPESSFVPQQTSKSRYWRDTQLPSREVLARPSYNWSSSAAPQPQHWSRPQTHSRQNSSPEYLPTSPSKRQQIDSRTTDYWTEPDIQYNRQRQRAAEQFVSGLSLAFGKNPERGLPTVPVETLDGDYDNVSTASMTDDEWTKVAKSPLVSKDAKAKGKRRWIVGEEEEVARGSESEWSVISSP